jgi:hypothetical protein
MSAVTELQSLADGRGDRVRGALDVAEWGSVDNSWHAVVMTIRKAVPASGLDDAAEAGVVPVDARLLTHPRMTPVLNPFDFERYDAGDLFLVDPEAERSSSASSWASSRRSRTEIACPGPAIEVLPPIPNPSVYTSAHPEERRTCSLPPPFAQRVLRDPEVVGSGRGCQHVIEQCH